MILVANSFWGKPSFWSSKQEIGKTPCYSRPKLRKLGLECARRALGLRALDPLLDGGEGTLRSTRVGIYCKLLCV